MALAAVMSDSRSWIIFVTAQYDHDENGFVRYYAISPIKSFKAYGNSTDLNLATQYPSQEAAELAADFLSDYLRDGDENFDVFVERYEEALVRDMMLS